jgi:phage baseplate assembly protein W
MAGISPKLPLQLNPEDGLALTKTLKEMIKQNLKMLILTAPGERLMIPEYGVGLRNFLFEQNADVTRAALSNAIRDQVRIYMPFVNLGEVIYDFSEVNPQILNLSVLYSVPNIVDVDSLDIEIDGGSSY